MRELGRLPTQEELDRIVAPLLEALQTLHAADFLHRDIAPDNIIVRADGTPVLLDFGAARRAVAEMSRVFTGIVKAGYSPHEQYSSDGRLQGPWSDLYALGGTLYRAVSGHPPEEATLRFDEDRMPPAARPAKGITGRASLRQSTRASRSGTRSGPVRGPAAADAVRRRGTESPQPQSDCRRAQGAD